MDFYGRVSIEKKGRSGQVRVAIEGQCVQLDWEFGGGDCIAFVVVPDPERWLGTAPYSAYPRSDFLNGLAREIARQECPGARFEIGRDGVYFYA
jgi:hypothetical protein